MIRIILGFFFLSLLSLPTHANSNLVACVDAMTNIGRGRALSLEKTNGQYILSATDSSGNTNTYRNDEPSTIRYGETSWEQNKTIPQYLENHLTLMSVSLLSELSSDRLPLYVELENQCREYMPLHFRQRIVEASNASQEGLAIESEQMSAAN